DRRPARPRAHRRPPRGVRHDHRTHRRHDRDPRERRMIKALDAAGEGKANAYLKRLMWPLIVLAALLIVNIVVTGFGFIVPEVDRRPARPRAHRRPPRGVRHDHRTHRRHDRDPRERRMIKALDAAGEGKANAYLKRLMWPLIVLAALLIVNIVVTGFGFIVPE